MPKHNNTRQNKLFLNVGERRFADDSLVPVLSSMCWFCISGRSVKLCNNNIFPLKVIVFRTYDHFRRDYFSFRFRFCGRNEIN